MWRVVVLGVAALTAGCRSPTQITFDVSTDVDCANLQSTTLVAGPLAALTDGRPATTTAPKCTGAGHIGSLVVVPSGSDTDLVAVKITTGVDVPPDQCGPHGEGCIVAKRALRFEPHAPLTVNVTMSTKCEGIECEGEETCVEGVCRSAVIGDPTSCEGAGCDESELGTVDGGGAVGDAGPTLDATLPSDGATDGFVPPPPVEAGVVATSIGISINFACALLSDHTVWCWGSDENGELGDGYEDAATYAPTPVRVPGLDHVQRLAVGEAHVCVVLDDGGVSCWGFAGDGATGTNDSTDDLVPTHVGGMGPVDLISAGQYDTCAASVDGRTIWCWGIYLDDDDGSDVPTPMTPVDAGIVELSAGRALTCGRFDDGVVRCWGQNSWEGLGQGSAFPPDASTPTPLPVAGLSDTAQLSVSISHACAVDSSHVVRCWGENDDGELGAIDAGNATGTPMTFPIDPHVTKVACGVFSACFLYDDAGTQCWGYDNEGEIGVPDVGGSRFPDPVSITNLPAARDVFAGGFGQCAILIDGGVMCWGNDTNQQLGAGPGLGQMPIGAFPVVF